MHIYIYILFLIRVAHAKKHYGFIAPFELYALKQKAIKEFLWLAEFQGVLSRITFVITAY